jgi:hypothetical protein
LQGKIKIEGEKVSYHGIMPGHYSLKDGEVAAVQNYILTSWGNKELSPKDFRPIGADEVKAQRGKHLTGKDVHEMRRGLNWSK